MNSAYDASKFTAPDDKRHTDNALRSVILAAHKAGDMFAAAALAQLSELTGTDYRFVDDVAPGTRTVNIKNFGSMPRRIRQ